MGAMIYCWKFDITIAIGLQFICIYVFLKIYVCNRVVTFCAHTFLAIPATNRPKSINRLRLHNSYIYLRKKNTTFIFPFILKVVRTRDDCDSCKPNHKNYLEVRSNRTPTQTKAHVVVFAVGIDLI